MNLKGFFVELRRRQVYRAAAAYGAISWLLIQIATQVFPFFEIPNSTVRFVVIALIVGFPIAMLLAWLYQLTPEGFVREEEIDPRTRKNLGRKMNFVIIGVLLLVIALLIYQRIPFRSVAGETISHKSIAVLPFDNLSDDKANAFFADGIQDDILTNLTKIRDLRVISRTSVERYRERKSRQSLREIGQALGAANVLEGSVRREGNRVAVNVQLIDAMHDRHLWAQRYDRTLDDSLGLEGQLAREIADALNATLTPEEKARVERKPTENTDAWVLYLRGLQYLRNPDKLFQDMRTADQLFSEAIQLDPKFAAAHAALAITTVTIFHFSEPLDTWKEKARQEADLALQLGPNLSEGHYALGLCLYWIDSDYEGASRELSRAATLAPNDSEIQLIAAAILRRQGKWSEALAAFERAQQLDPQNPNVVRNVLFTNTAMRRWSEATRVVARFRAISPDSMIAKIQSAYVAFVGYGDVNALRREMANTPPGMDPDGVVTTTRWEGAMLERDYKGALEILEDSPLAEMEYLLGGSTPKSFLQGCTWLAQGNQSEAEKAFAAAVVDFEKAVQDSPESATSHANLGLCYAHMGRHDEAIREGLRATELKPETKDATDGTLMSCYLALIYARVGEKDLAFPLIERLLKTPGSVDSVCYSITTNDLKFRWQWDPLRNDPRFQKLIVTN
ncbi:MAG TPA: tetratricopeptide repeat protein [Chthoniobacterales bacterium]|nr:tetratricopeptide repeat protein [Chthoniobacterales bacterium]